MTNFEPFKMVTTRNLTKGTSLKTGIFLIISVLFLYSCKSEKRPEGIMSQQEFSNLLVLVYTSEARLNATTVSRDSAMKLFIPFEKTLLEKHHISDEVLKKTYRYYVEHPAEFEKAFDVVIDTLSLREQRNFSNAYQHLP